MQHEEKSIRSDHIFSEAHRREKEIEKIIMNFSLARIIRQIQEHQYPFCNQEFAIHQLAKHIKSYFDTLKIEAPDIKTIKNILKEALK